MDKKHRDWLLKTQQALILKTNSDISTEIIDTPNDGKQLLLRYINEESFANLEFVTNTDQNNNYLYLEDFELILKGSIYPLEFPGLKETMIKMFEISDANAFLEGKRTHKPFFGGIFNGKQMPEYIDTVCNLLPFNPNTFGVTKYYNLVLNPDSIPGKK